MIRGERDQRVLQADGLVDTIEQLADDSIGPNGDVAHLRRLRAVVVADRIVGREADGHQIRDATLPHALVGQGVGGECEQELVAERTAKHRFIEWRPTLLRQLLERHCGRRERRPLLAEVRVRQMAVVECLDPCGNVRHVVRARNERP
jgi:hypothetical protein